MNKNKLIGIILVIAGIMLLAVLAFTQGGVLANCIGKAAWFLPYALFVKGAESFVRS